MTPSLLRIVTDNSPGWRRRSCAQYCEILFYADDAAFDGLAWRSAQLLKLLMRRGPDRGYFPETAKSLFISDTLGQDAVAKREFAAEGLPLNFC